MSPEGDVDVGGTPEPEMMAQDGEGDAIIHQLERSLPRWEGFAEVGWSLDIPEVGPLSRACGSTSYETV